MNAVVALFAIFLLVMGLIGFAAPNKITGLMQHWSAPWRYRWAIGLRIILGLVLLLAAPQALLPLVLGVLGVLALIAALGLTLCGQERFDHLVAWWLGLKPVMMRISCLFVVLIGLLMLAAVWPMSTMLWLSQA